MNSRPMRLVAIAVVLAGLGVALPIDLRNYFEWRGETALLGGNADEAVRAFQRSMTLGNEGPKTRRWLAASLYRQRHFEQARTLLGDTLAGETPARAATMHYNRGNTLYRLAQQAAAQDPVAARRLWQAAIDDYKATLAIESSANDARDNLTLSHAQLAALPIKKPATDAESKGRAADDTVERPTEQPDATHTAAERASNQKARQAAAEGKHSTDTSSAPMPTAPPKYSLSRAEAETLLNDARGRTRVLAPSIKTDTGGHTSRPDKDW